MSRPQRSGEPAHRAPRSSSGLSPSVVLFACLFAAQASVLVLSPILPDIAAEFGMSTATAAQLRSISGLTAGLSAFVVAAAGDRVALRSLLYAGLGLLAVASTGSALAPSFLALVVTHVLIGLALSFVVSGALAASEAWAPAGEQTRTLSWALIGQPVAWVVGQPLVGLVGDVGWRWAWAAVPLSSSLVALAIVRARDRTVSVRHGVADPLGLRSLPGLRPWALGELLAFSAWGGTLVYAGAFFVETYDVTTGVAGMLLGIGAAAYLPGNFLGRAWLSRGPAGPLLAFGTAAAAMSLVFGGVRPAVVFSTAAFSILAFFSAGRTIAGAALGLHLSGGHRLAAMSVRTAMQQFGYLIGSVVGGVVLARWGYGGFGLAFTGMFLAATALLVPAARRARAAAAPRRAAASDR